MSIDPGGAADDTELDRIASLPVSERAAEFSQLHQQLGELLESTPVQLFDEDSA